MLPREDAALPLSIDGGGSLQNPCFSPDGDNLVFTRWHGGNNEPPATVERMSLAGGGVSPLSPPGAVSVNLPGAYWHADRGIVFSTDEFDDRDEIYLMQPDGSGLVQLTDRPGFVAFEPSLAPSGDRVVFESHVEDTDDSGALFKVRTDGSELVQLTDGTGDDRQPNWSPDGSRIVFQSHGRIPGNIDLFTMDPDGGAITNVTNSPFEDTDASFSPDGQQIVYSSDEGELELANLFVI